jgi:hypothetical protein
MLCSERGFLAKTAAYISITAWNKKIFFLFSLHVSRARLKELSLWFGKSNPRCAGPKQIDSISKRYKICNVIRLRPFGKPPNVHYDSLHEIGWLVP